MDRGIFSVPEKPKRSKAMKTRQFGGIPEEYSNSRDASVVILPVPYDGTSTWVKGSDRGPEAILEASENMELYDIDTDAEVYRIGIHTDDPVEEKCSPETMARAVRRRVSGWLAQDKMVVTLGGEHSVSIGAIQAYVEKYKDLCVLQIDAHTDLRPEYEGSKYNHACVMARVREVCPFVQVGIRSMDVSEKPYLPEGRVFFARDIRGGLVPDWTGMVAKMLKGHVYITLDLDGLDPSVVPSTGTPEPGGLYYHEVLGLFRKVAAMRPVVGFDIVELCPGPAGRAPDFLAAKLLYQVLGMIFCK